MSTETSGGLAQRRSASGEGRGARKLVVRRSDRILLVDVDAVDWIAGSDNYVELHLGPRRILLRETLTSLERRLDPRQFVRIHRSTIVQRDRIRELRALLRGEWQVLLHSGAQLKLTRGYRRSLDTILDERG